MLRIASAPKRIGVRWAPQNAGVGSFEEQPDGSLLFEHEYSDDESLISWMLSCRDKVTVIEPESVRDKLYEIACDMAEKYERKGKKHGKQSTDGD